MRNALALTVAGIVLLAAACSQRDDLWFDGDFAAASAVAKRDGALMMLVFTADWCSWCQRMDRETFAAAEVRDELAGVVALKIDAEGKGRSVAKRYGVDSYPTIVFVDGDGDEIDRILGYLPPSEFIAHTRRIRAGDTFLACLHRLSEDPADTDAIARAVSGLLERSDAEGAISRIKAFHRATGEHQHAMCDELMFEARTALHSRLYSLAGKLYRKGWEPSLAVPDAEGTRHLRSLMAKGFADHDPADQAELLRRARHDDAGELLALVDRSELAPEALYEVADFAFRNGHYEVAGEAYREWRSAVGRDADPDELNAAAWHLYLARTSLEEAVELARSAYDRQASGDVADTLARLLYLQGDVDEAIRLQRLAVEGADASTTASYNAVLKRMETGQPLGDQPAFEHYPGAAAEIAAGASSSPL